MKKFLALLLTVTCLCAATAVFASCGETPPKGPAKPAFTVATNTPFEPFEYMGTDGKIYGIDIEIALGFCEKYGYELHVRDIAFDAILTQVAAGYADIGMAGMTVNDERLVSNDFTDTYYSANQKIIVLSSNTDFDACTTAAEVENVLGAAARGTKVGYQNGTTGNWYVAGDADWGFDGFANVAATGYDSAQLAVMDMVNGNLYAVVVDNAPADAIAAAMNGQVKVIDVNLTDEDYAFAIQKGNATLQSNFNAYLAEIKANGKLQEIVDKYFGESENARVGASVIDH